MALRISSTIRSTAGRQNLVCWSVAIAPSLLAVRAAFSSSTPWVSIAWNHSGGWTVSWSARSLRTSAIGVFFGMPYFHIAAALMMQRMLTVRPNWLSFQSWKVLSNMAMPVALSGRG